MKRASFVASVQLIILFGLIVNWLYFIIKEIKNHGKWELLFFLISIPFAFAFITFPINFFVNNLVNLFYPSKKLREDSKYYAYSKPELKRDVNLPSVDIHIPVYTEDFLEVIVPTLESSMIAKNYYRGICQIIVADDGICKLDTILAQQRIDYYNKNNISFLARPSEGRKGRFKKSSNMNNIFCTNEYLCSRNIRYIRDIETIGDYIILLDADSRIPKNAIELGVSFMIDNPNVGFLQFSSKPLINYKLNCFSRQIGRFTKNLFRIVFPIVTRGGEPSPLIGHNVMLRFEAMDKVKKHIFEENRFEYWSEDKVSEDFDMSIRLQSEGYIGVYSVFCEFEEGVSLSYEDELSKLSKFAYGASELIFSKNFWRFLICKHIPWYSKVNLTSYLFSYFAIASSIIVSPIHLILTCFIEDWFILTFEPVIVMLFSMILFSVLGPLSSMSILYRTQNSKTVCTQFWHGIFMFIFYTGVPFSIFKGIISHIFRLSLQWGATRKTINTLDTTCNVFYHFKFQYIVMIIYTLILVVSSGFICPGWYIYIPTIVMITGHLLSPFLMNTYLTIWTKFKCCTLQDIDDEELELRRLEKGLQDIDDEELELRRLEKGLHSEH